MIPRSHLLLSVWALLAMLAFARPVRGQSANLQGGLSNTDYGKSQNEARDLANSLTPGKQNPTKGEKKSEVDPKTLQSKKMKDPAFEGGLNDLGLDWTGDKMGKPNGSQGAKKTDSTAPAKKEQQATDQGSTSAKPKTETAGDKEQKSASPAPADKSEEKAKTSAAKTDGDH